MDNKCIKAHDDWASDYDDYDTKPFFQFLSEIINLQVKNHIPKCGKILDAAGGTGTNAISLANKGYDVVMTELSDKMISFTKLKKDSDKIRIVKSDLINMNQFQDNEFDFAMCVGNAVSYCDSLKALNELKRVSKSGSYIIFDIHSFYQLQRKCIKSSDSKKLERLQKSHLFFNEDYDEHGFTIEEIEKLVSDSGLELIEIFGKMILPNIQNTDKMNELLTDKEYYKLLFNSEIKVFNKKEYLSCALELGVVCKVK